MRDPELDYRLVEHLLDLVSVFDADGRVVYASPSHERVLGYRPEELVGRSPLELVHEHDREAARAAFEQADGLASFSRVRHRDGHWVHLEGKVSAVPGSPARLLAVSRDVTARVRADRLREAHFGVTRALATARSIEAAADEVLRVIAEQLGWDTGLLWKVDVEAQHVRCVALWSAPSATPGEFEALSRRMALRLGEGLPGRVWASGAPAWIPDVAADRGLPRRVVAEREGVRSGVAVPVDCGGTTWGVMEFFARETREPEEDVLSVLATLGAQLGQFVERMAAEQAVRDQERRKRAVVDAALDCVVTMDHHGRIVEFNPAAERTFGYSAAEVIGRELADVLVPPALRDRHRAGLARYLETGEGTLFGRRLEMPALAAGGREIPVELTIARVDLPGPPLFSGYIRDISERLRTGEALRASRALLQAVADGTPDALFVKDLSGRYLLMNQAGARALDRNVDEVLGATDADLLPPTTAAELMDADRRVMESGETLVAEERIGGRTFLATKAPYRDEGGAVVGVLGVAHDITERRRLEEELQHAQKMEAVGRLAGGVAHDFNNLLTVIRGFSDKALEQLTAGVSNESSLREVVRATDRATALTKQLLSLSRRAPLDTESLDLNVIVAEMDALLRRTLGEDVRLVTVFGASPATVHANRAQLEQVILNLAINARDAMPEGGQLTIETADASLDAETAGEMVLRPGAHVVLRVSDTGSGMDAETRARAFEPFFTTKARGRGTGLGLSTVYGIVTQSGGHVALETSVGAGTTFVIHLPAAEHEAAPQASEPRPTARRLSRGTLLVAEDDDALRALFEITLREQDFDVLTARSGEDALAVADLHGGDIDVLLTDVVMPGMRGPELAARLRQRHPRLRVIFATGYSDQPLIPEMRPGDELLAKPFPMADLVDVVTRLDGNEQDARSSA